MVKLTEEIKKLIETTQLGFFATASLDGKSNVSPKGTIRVLDDEHLIFAEIFSPHTRENLLENPQISVFVLNKEKKQGCQIKGKTELLDSGKLFDEITELLKQRNMKPNYVVKVHVEEIYPFPEKR